MAPTKRERRHECSKYIRHVKGQRYQLRIWLGNHLPVRQANAGLFVSEWLAERVRDRLVCELRTPADMAPLGFWRALSRVLAEFAARGYDDLPSPLPAYVRRKPDGTYFAKVKKAGEVLTCPGPYTDPADAHNALMRLLRDWAGTVRTTATTPTRPHFTHACA